MKYKSKDFFFICFLFVFFLFFLFKPLQGEASEEFCKYDLALIWFVDKYSVKRDKMMRERFSPDQNWKYKIEDNKEKITLEELNEKVLKGR